jgi:hypothetical protein
MWRCPIHRYVWRYSSTILNLETRWRWVISFTSQPLFLRGKSLRYPFDRLGGPQRGSERCEEKKISYYCRKSNPDSSAVHPFTRMFYATFFWPIKESDVFLWRAKSLFIRNETYKEIYQLRLKDAEVHYIDFSHLTTVHCGREVDQARLIVGGNVINHIRRFEVEGWWCMKTERKLC